MVLDFTNDLSLLIDWSYRPDVAVGGNHRLHRHPTLLGGEEKTSPSRAFVDE